MKTGERLRRFLDFIHLNTYRFELEAGLSISSASRVIQGRHEFSTPNLLRIHKRYPELNLDWFLTGRGKMLVDKTEGEQEKTHFSDELAESIRILEQKIELRRENELQIKDSRKTLEKELLALKGKSTYPHG